MGWWSSTIMGGDTPLDLEGYLSSHVLRDSITRKSLNANIEKVTQFVKDPSRFCQWAVFEDADIARQVIGYHILKTGAEMPDEVRALIRKANKKLMGKKALKMWKVPDERLEYIQAFDHAVKHYDGKMPVDVENEGLLEAFERYVECKKPRPKPEKGNRPCCRVPIANGQYLCFPGADTSPDGVEDLWFEDEDGNELLYYYHTEWAEDPQLVMGAILACIQNGVEERELA